MVRNVDPTHTTTLRNAFAMQMNKRFNALIKKIQEAIVTHDVFGLSGLNSPFTLSVQQGEGAFAFPRSADKVRAFMRWLENQIESGILTVGEFDQLGVGVETAWTNKYILETYKRGLIRARYEMKKQGANIPDLPDVDPFGQFNAGFGLPLHLDRLGLLYTRVFSELKGITAQMDQQISRVLAQGIADGDNPRVLARKLRSVIDGLDSEKLGITDSLGRYIPAKRRAEILARTEIIRAHHQAMIQEYMNWGVEGVTILAEWKTAGDHRVCSQCETMEGEVFTLEVAMNMIPLHPQCRCLALPYRKDWQTIRDLIPENPI
jgi:SPP1 gp7 family putative phage head morphogenesis protein